MTTIPAGASAANPLANARTPQHGRSGTRTVCRNVKVSRDSNGGAEGWSNPIARAQERFVAIEFHPLIEHAASSTKPRFLANA